LVPAPTTAPAAANATTYPTFSAGVPVTGANQYTVRAGDTLWSIAQQFGLTLDTLERANAKILDPNVIVPGQVLVIPPAGAPAAAGVTAGTTAPTATSVPATRMVAPSPTPAY
jgi:LysM repeat protein